MENEKNSQIGVIVVTGLIALLGTIAGGVIKGYWDISLAEKEFQTNLVMKSLEPEELEARIESLRFMIESNLISDEFLRNGLEGYLEKKPKILPRFRASVDASSKILYYRTEETKKYTDFNIFVCDNYWNDNNAQKLAASITDALWKAGRAGQIRLKKWTLYYEVPLRKLKGKITIIVDQDHPEANELTRIKSILRKLKDLPKIEVVDNPGKDSPWLISIVICPDS
jgi:hypothetical protein